MQDQTLLTITVITDDDTGIMGPARKGGLMEDRCIICDYPADTDINGDFLCQRHYDDVKQRKLRRGKKPVSEIITLMQTEWMLLVDAGVEQPYLPEDQRLRAIGAPELPGLE